MHTDAELQRVCRLCQAVLSEMTARVRIGGGDQSDVLMDRTVLRRVQGAISYKMLDRAGI